MKEVTLLVLTVENLSKNFKGLKAVNNLSMSLEEEEIVGIIGPNGAGKTTIFNLITGLLKPEPKSKITFLNENITLKSSYKIARKGISRTFQKIKLFSHLTVLENVIIGAQKNNESGFLSKPIFIFAPDKTVINPDELKRCILTTASYLRSLTT